MKLPNVYSFLEKAGQLDLIVEFRDGDAYRIQDLDLAKSLGEDDEPIVAYFENCIRRSNAWEAAMKTEPLSIAGVIWTSEQPSEPVGTTYYPNDITGILDVAKGYRIYQANQ